MDQQIKNIDNAQKEISKIKLANNETYNLKDAVLREQIAILLGAKNKD